MSDRAAIDESEWWRVTSECFRCYGTQPEPCWLCADLPDLEVVQSPPRGLTYRIVLGP